jgi:hypothetical protein
LAVQTDLFLDTEFLPLLKTWASIENTGHTSRMIIHVELIKMEYPSPSSLSMVKLALP